MPRRLSPEQLQLSADPVGDLGDCQMAQADREKMQKKYPKAMVVPATIDEIMLLYVKGER